MSGPYLPKTFGGKHIKSMNPYELLAAAQELADDIYGAETTLKFLGEADAYIEELEERLKKLEATLQEKEAKLKGIIENLGYITAATREDLNDLRLNPETSLRWCVIKLEDMVDKNKEGTQVEAEPSNDEPNKPYDESVF